MVNGLEAEERRKFPRKTQKGILLYEEESYLVRGSIFEVRKALGSGFPERVYQNALLKSLKKRGMCIEQEKKIPIYFDGSQIANFRVDLVVNDSILIELKAVPCLFDDHKRQFWQYLKGSKFRLRLLPNSLKGVILNRQAKNLDSIQDKDNKILRYAQNDKRRVQNDTGSGLRQQPRLGFLVNFGGKKLEIERRIYDKAREKT